MKRSYQGEHVPEIHFLHLKVALEGERPVWRRLRVSNQLTLRALHEVLQVTMGWSSSSSHRIQIGHRVYVPDGRRRRLGGLVAPGVVFRYVHEEREHIVEVEGWSAILPDDPRTLCLDGAGAPEVGLGAFDPGIVNAVLAAMWERPPHAALN